MLETTSLQATTGWMPEKLTVNIDGVAAAFAAPAAQLAELVIDYGFYDSGLPGSRRRLNHYLPGPANVVFTVGAGPIDARIRNHQVAWRDGAMLFGPTSQMMQVESDGGRLIGFGVTPLGWARLFGKHAKAYANKVVPLAAVLGDAAAATLYDQVTQATTVGEAAAALDAGIAPLLRPAPRDERLIAALAAAIRDPAVVDCDVAIAHVGANEGQVRRVAQHYFGFGPKLLLRRHRFVRAAMAVIEHGNGADLSALPGDYYDQSHFIRDAQAFLGMTARQFARDLTPLMNAMRRGRAAAFGRPLQGLIEPGRDNLARHATAPATAG